MEISVWRTALKLYMYRARQRESVDFINEAGAFIHAIDIEDLSKLPHVIPIS